MKIILKHLDDDQKRMFLHQFLMEYGFIKIMAVGGEEKLDDLIQKIIDDINEK